MQHWPSLLGAASAALCRTPLHLAWNSDVGTMLNRASALAVRNSVVTIATANSSLSLSMSLDGCEPSSKLCRSWSAFIRSASLRTSDGHATGIIDACRACSKLRTSTTLPGGSDDSRGHITVILQAVVADAASWCPASADLVGAAREMIHSNSSVRSCAEYMPGACGIVAAHA